MALLHIFTRLFTANGSFWPQLTAEECRTSITKMQKNCRTISRNRKIMNQTFVCFVLIVLRWIFMSHLCRNLQQAHMLQMCDLDHLASAQGLHHLQRTCMRRLKYHPSPCLLTLKRTSCVCASPCMCEYSFWF